jgi:type I restriction enzyme S subunit
MSPVGHQSSEATGTRWLGEVPSHWQVTRLKNAADYRVSNVDKVPAEGEEPVRLCNYTDVYYREHLHPDLDLMQTTATAAEIRRFHLQVGDVVITKDSEEWSDIAVPALVTGSAPDLVCGYHLAIVRPRPNRLSGPFLLRVFQAAGVNTQLQVSASGITRYSLPKDAIGEAVIPLPPLEEQRAIADFLDRETADIDSLVGKQNRLVDSLIDKRQAAICQLVTRGLNPTATLVPSGVEWLGEVPKLWEIYRIGSLFREASDVGEDGLPILTVSIHDGVSDRQLDDEERERKVIRIEDTSKYKKVIPSDLVYNMMRAWQGGFGAVLVAGLVSPAYVVARPRRPLVTKFIELLLRTPAAIEEMRCHSYGVADFRLRLYWDHFKTLRVALPPLAEQHEIVEAAQRETESIDALVKVIEVQNAKLGEYRSALISAAVTGQIDVRNYRPQEAAALCQ